MIDIKQYLEETNTVLITKEAFDCLKERACALDNAISRTRAMETFERWAEHKDYTHVERHILHAVVDELRAMPSISEQPAEGGNHDGME